MDGSHLQETYDLVKEVFILLDDGDRRCLKQYNLTPVQFYALWWLEDTPGMTLGELSRGLLCSKSNVTRVVDRMERKDLLVRERDKADRRVIRVSLTPAGKQLCREASQIQASHVSARMSVLPEADLADLLGLLRTLKSALESQLGEASPGS